MRFIKRQATGLKKLLKNKRRLTFLALNLAMTIFSALMIWKCLIVITNTVSPIIVVPNGSIDPAFEFGDVLFITNYNVPIHAGEAVVFKPTLGYNRVDDRAIYLPGKLWLQREEIFGRVQGTVSYLGLVTLLLNVDSTWWLLLVRVLGWLLLIKKGLYYKISLLIFISLFSTHMSRDHDGTEEPQVFEKSDQIKNDQSMRYLLLFISLGCSWAFFVPVLKLNNRCQSLSAAESPLQDFSNKITSQITSKTTAIQTSIVETPKRVQESVDRLVKLPEELYNNATTTVNNIVVQTKATADTLKHLPTNTQILIEEIRRNVSKGFDDFVYTVNTPRRVFALTWKSLSSLSRKAVDTVYDITDKPVVTSSKPVPVPKMIAAKRKTQKPFSFNAFKDNVYAFIDTTTATITFLITAPGKVWRSVSSTAINTVEFVTSIPDTVTNTAQTITESAKTTQTKIQAFVASAWSIITLQELRKFVSEKSAAIDTVLSKSENKELTPGKAWKVINVLISNKDVVQDGESKFIPSTVATTSMRSTAKAQQSLSTKKKVAIPSIPNPFKLVQDVSAEVKGFQKRLDENRKAQGLVQPKNIAKKQTLQPSPKPITIEIKEIKEEVEAPSAFVTEVKEMVQARPALDVAMTEEVKEKEEKVKVKDEKT